jgi:putative endonuclease
MKTVKFLYVYILKCADNSYYTGITNNPERRLKQHNKGSNKNAYTYNRLPVELVYCELFTNFDLAIEWENKIKKWSRIKKEALINSDWKKLMFEAECKNETSHKNISRYKK